MVATTRHPQTPTVASAGTVAWSRLTRLVQPAAAGGCAERDDLMPEPAPPWNARRLREIFKNNIGPPARERDSTGERRGQHRQYYGAIRIHYRALYVHMRARTLAIGDFPKRFQSDNPALPFLRGYISVSGPK